MAKQLNVDMRFNADTSQAKKAIQDLQTSLMKISSTGAMAGATKDMQTASAAAKELSYHLNQAFNVDTGKFDLSRLDRSLKTSGTNVTKLSSQLLSAGQNGQQAFVQLAQSIAAADRPMITLSSRMADLATTMKNTVKWQISSSVLHGFMGAVQTAYGYAQDLNESLNNIRIVTGANINEMARFAEQANKAAKALSATTTDYTNASLIYYQQGLNDQQVQERTDITIKMANVARQSAEIVSDQMTAVWNNFDNGSKSLEYYADVMTALGAATASSTDEIAAGLEKFAAVSETVGLSYEYATAALATVTDKTRQSADVVGTAFKTMFARIQGLKLGETLEDGTDFNQYSEALMAVGVNIKTANGELKNMDTILNEMAAVWETLNRDEQVALAQKVAGVRQYNQLVSLMENWDAMEINLGVVETSEGALQEQADIYAESWEAAQDRVRASMEAIYTDLINDEFFIDLSDGFSVLLDSLDAFIDGFGGVKMIIASVASVLMAAFAHKVPGAIENLKTNFSILFKGASAQAQQLAKDMTKVTQKAKEDYSFSTSSKTALDNATALNTMNNKLAAVQDKMTDKERQQYQQEVEILKVLELETQQLADSITKREEGLNLLKQEVQLNTMPVVDERTEEEERLIQEKRQKKEILDKAKEEPNKQGNIRRAEKSYKEAEKALSDYRKETERMSNTQNAFVQELFNSSQQLDKIENNAISVGSAFELYQQQLDNISKIEINNDTDLQNVKEQLKNVNNQIQQITNGSIPGLDAAFKKAFQAKTAGQLKTSITGIKTALEQAKVPADQVKKIMESFGFSDEFEEYSRGVKIVNQELEKLRQKQAQINQIVKDFNPTHVVTGLERVTQTAAGLGQIAMLIQSIRSIFDAWNNDDLSFGEKLTTTLMGLSMIIPSLIGSVKSFNTVLSAEGKTLLEQIVLRKTYQSLLQNNTTAKIVNTTAEKLSNQAQKEGNKIDEETLKLEIQKQLIEQGIAEGNISETMSLNILNLAKLQSKKATEGETVASGQLTLARILENAANQSLLATLKQLIVLYGPYLAIAGLAVGAIASIVYVIKQLEENSLENQFNKASEAAKEAADNYDKAKQSLEEIKSTIEDLKTIEDPFKNLNKGTIEWNNALLEANNEITKLINKYPELINYVKESSSVPGLNVITEEGYEYLQKMAFNTASSAAAHSFMAQNNKLDASNQKLISENTFKYDEVEEHSWITGVLRQLKGEISLPTKTITTKEISKSELDKIVTEMALTGKNAREAAEAVGISNLDLLNAVEQNSDKLNSITSSYAQNLMAIKENTAAIIENTNSSNEEYSNSEYKDFIKATNVDSRITKEKEELQKKDDTEIIADYEAYLKEITGAEHKVEDGKVKKYDEETGTYSEIGDYAADKALDILAKAAAYKFSDEEINQIEETGKQYTDEIEKLKVTDSEGKAVALTEDQIKDIALGIYQAEQDGTQFNIGNVLKDLGTYNISTSSMTADMQNKFSSTVQEGSFAVEGYTPDQQNLIDSAEGYDIAKEKVEEYKESLNELAFLQDKLNKLDKKDTKQGKQLNQEIKAQKELIKTQEDEIKTLATVGKAAEKYGLNEKELLIQTKQLAKQYKLTNEQAANVAVRNQRLNKGVEALSENWSDWKKTLKATDKTTTDYSGTVVELTSTIADLVGASEDLELSPEFFESAENMSLLEKASKGNITAINALGAAVAAESVKLLDFNYILAEAANQDIEGPKLSLDQFNTDKAAVLAGIEELKTGIQNGTIEVGDGISAMDSNWIDSLNRMAIATGMSVDQMNSLLNELGVEATVTTTSVKQQMSVPTYTEVVQKNPDGIDTDGDGDEDAWGYKRYTIPGEPKVVDGWVQVAQIETGDDAGKGPKVKELTYTGRGTPAPSSTGKGKSGGGGGGGSSPKKAQPTKKSDIVDRYKEQDDKLDDLKRTMDNTADSFDRLYGEDKLEAIDKLIQAEKDYKDVLKEKRSEARDALDEDRKALNAAASKVSVKFEYDAEGNLINYTEQMEALYNRLRTIEKAAGDEWTESEQKQIDALKEKIEALKEAQEQYENTRELIEDLSDELTQLAGKPALPPIKSDYIDIYKEVIDALDDIDERLERITKRSDDLLGKNRLSYFEKFEGTSEEKLSLLEEEITRSTADIKENKNYLNKVIKLLDLGEKAQFDKNGNLTNYDELTDIIWNQIFEKYEEFRKGGITDTEQQILDSLYGDLDMFTSAATNYTDSVEYREDLRAEKKELTDSVTILPVVTSDFLDIYKEADDILDDIEEKVSRISEEADRATGKDKVANLKELAKLEKERLAYIKKEQEINTSDKQEKRKALGTARKKLGITTKFKFDENGNITNYNEIMQEYEQKYTEARADAAADGTITAGENEWLEKFKEDGQYLEEYIEQYSNAVEKGEELEQAAIDAAYAAEDYLLEALNFTIEFGIEANDRDLQQIEFQLSQLEDQAYMTAEAMALLDKKYQNLQRQTDIYTDGISTILNDNFTQDEIDQFLASGDLSGLDLSKISQTELDMLNSYADGLVGLQEELLALRDTMNGAVIKAFEEWTAEMQEQLSLFDHYDSVINSYTNIIDLVGQERLGITDENIKEYNQLKVNNATNRLTSSKAYYEETGEKIQSLEAKRAESQARLEAAQSSGDASAIAAAQNELKSWDEALKTMREENRNAEQQYLSDWEAALQASRDAFLAETDIQLKALEERMAGTYGTIANMQEEFKRQTEKNDRYLQDYEKIYELSKLNRDLTNKMDETTNIKAKKELAKLQEEILDYQKEGRQMSDYDLKYLKKKYELKLAEIALEEAQNAKTQVRLTRDSEGNYSYTYTADEDSIAKAQQTYEDKLYEMTTLSNDYIEQQTSKLLSAQQEYVNKLAEIHKKAAEGQYATTEEYQQALDEVTAYYTDLMIYYGDEIDKAAENNATVYENDYQTYSGYALSKAGASKTEAEEYINWVQAKSAAEAGFITSITELLPDLSDAHSNATGYVESMVKTIGSAKEETGLLGQASESYKTLSGNIEGAMQAAGTSMGTFKDTTYEKLITDEDSIANASEETKNNILGIVSATDALDDTIEAVANWQTKYSAELQKIIDKAGDVVTAINNMNLVLAQQAADEEDKEDLQPGKVTETLENPIDLKDKKNKKEEETPKLTQTASSLITSVIPDIAKNTNPPTAEDNSNKLKTASEKTKKGVAYAIWSGYWGNGNSRKTLVNKKLGKGAYKTYQELVSNYDIATKAKNGTWEKDLFGKYLAAGEGQKKLKNTYGPSAFFTGGYTGAWGPNGKLAILHEKELVLNKEDTSNMLKIVSMVRDLSAALDSKAYYASLAQLRANQLYQVNPTGETFEQTVTIHAEFPHATNAIEIETALNNLVNSASQFANRK